MNPRFSQKNVPIGQEFVDRLRNLRTRQRLTKPELADKAGISIRTLQDLEAGRKTRVQEKTLLLLAQALEVEPDDLLGSAPVATDQEPPDGNERPRGLPRASGLVHGASGLIVAIIVVVAAITAFWHWSSANATWTREDGRVTAHAALIGTTLWTTEPTPRISACIDSPWSPRQILLGSDYRTPEGGRVICVDRANGDTLWVAAPDVDAVVRAFGPEVVNAANFGCKWVLPADLDGDGERELIVDFIHGHYYPEIFCVVDRHGAVESQYVHRGHAYDVMVTDLDRDGKDEILVAGTNNVPAYQGAAIYILDDVHRRGASVDSMSFPLSDEPDSALVRIVIPQFPAPYMQQMKISRLAATSIKITYDPSEQANISVQVGDAKFLAMLFTFDSQLRFIRCEPIDSFREAITTEWPDSLKNGRGPLDPTWLDEWLRGMRRFEAGHWPPKPGV